MGASKMEKQKKVILFDLGNVLIEWKPDQLFTKLLPNETARKNYLEKIDFIAWNAEQDAGRAWSEGEAELIKKFPEDAEIIKAYRPRFLETIGEVKLDVVDIMRELKNLGYKLYAASNWNAETFEMTRNRMIFLDLFDAVCLSGNIGLIKPDVRFFEHMMRQYAFSAEDALFIDDSAANIQAARSLGIRSIQFFNAQQLRGDLQKEKTL